MDESSKSVKDTTKPCQGCNKYQVPVGEYLIFFQQLTSDSVYFVIFTYNIRIFNH